VKSQRTLDWAVFSYLPTVRDLPARTNAAGRPTRAQHAAERVGDLDGGDPSATGLSDAQASGVVHIPPFGARCAEQNYATHADVPTTRPARPQGRPSRLCYCHLGGGTLCHADERTMRCAPVSDAMRSLARTCTVLSWSLSRRRPPVRRGCWLTYNVKDSKPC
jgi:hypothetical protein